MVYTYDFPRPSVAASVAVLCPSKTGLTVAVGRRTMNTNAFPGALCLPGGFLDKDEQAIHAAQRELQEEMNLRIELDDLRLFAEYSDPKLDPRTHVVSLFYFTEMSSGVKLKAGDDLVEASWISVKSILSGEVKLAFNHAEALADAYMAYNDYCIVRTHKLEEALKVLG